MGKHPKTVSDVAEKLFQLMKELGYSEATVRIYRRLYSDFFTFASVNCPEPVFTDQLTIDYMKDFKEKIDISSSSGKKRFRELHRLMNMLLDCNTHGVILRHKLSNRILPEPYAEEITAFCSYLIENGLSSGTAERNRFVLGQLAEFLLQHHVKNFSEMTMKDLLAFAATQMGYTKKTAAASMYALRVFIDYLAKTQINQTLSKDELPTVHHVNRHHLPKIWTDDECRRLLEAVERNSPAGKRDFAILTLAINYGLRTSDIIALKFSDIDWETGKIHFVQQKTGVPNTIIFDEATGWAIIDYIRNGRPDIKQYANVFLQAKPPYLPMNSFPSLQKYTERAGIHCEKERMHSMHSLRHSLATRMLHNGTPVGIIAESLGHADINSAVNYLQIDLGHLRQCALELEVDL